MKTDLTEFLPGLVYHYITDKDFRDLLTSCGFDPKDLPDSQEDFRSMITSFNEAKSKKETMWIFEKMLPFKGHESIEKIPRDESFNRWYKDQLFNSKVRAIIPDLSNDPEKFLSYYSELIKLKEVTITDVVSFSKTFDEEYGKFISDIESDKTLVEIPDWKNLSKMIGGFNPGRLSMLLANTGYGKTNFMVNLALSAAKRFPVMFINMEMLYEDIFRRIIVSLSDCTWDDIRNKKKPNPKTVIDKIVSINDLYITSGKDQSIEEIKNIARVYNSKSKLGLICVDYDQKLKLALSSKNPEWLELQRAFVELEDLAKELQTHIIVASQSSDDEGKVSGSNRSKFPCSSVLYFHEDEEVGPVIEPKKNRFGNYSKRLQVNYVKEKSLITEGDLIDGRRKKQEATIKRARKPNQPQSSFVPYKD